MELVSSHGCFRGQQRFYRHDSRVIGLPMRFSVYLPPQVVHEKKTVPFVMYLAGLTCSEETFPAKAGAQRMAAQLGLGLVSPDTSPRGADIPGEA
jgi:S-formylglutathione hydrolase